MNQQEMNTTIKTITRDRPYEEDIYLKYLPNELKHSTPAKYSFKTKITEEDDYLKGRLYSYADNRLSEFSKESDKRASYLKTPNR
jgi:hypothetical protein